MYNQMLSKRLDRPTSRSTSIVVSILIITSNQNINPILIIPLGTICIDSWTTN